MTTPQSGVEDTLGSEFWTQPQDTLDEVFSIIYAQTLTVLRDEVRERSGSAIDYMIVERLAFMYAHLRQREADSENVVTDRNRREMNKDWIDLATQMRKLWSAEDRDQAAEQILKKVDKSVSTVFDELEDTPQNRQLKKAFAAAFQANGV